MANYNIDENDLEDFQDFEEYYGFDDDDDEPEELNFEDQDYIKKDLINDDINID